MTNATANHGAYVRSYHVRWRGNVGLGYFVGPWTAEPWGERVLVGLWRHPERRFYCRQQ